MRKILIYIVFVMVTQQAWGQGDILATQFTYDKLGFNPAFAGNYDHVALNAVYRNQWLGLEGSPTRFSGSINFPSLDRKLGLGLQIDKSEISIFDQTTIQASYAYKIPTDFGIFSAGISTSFRQFIADWSDPQLRPLDGWANDPAVNPSLYKKTIFNFGAGLYFNTDHFFAGVSVPRLIKADIDFDDMALDTLQSVESRWIYIMLGGSIDLSPLVTVNPQALVAIPENGPMAFHAGLVTVFQDQYHLGFNLSSGASELSFLESLDFILGWQFNNSIFVGLAYDITLSPLKEHSSGSIELVLNYRFNRSSKADVIINPRYF